MSECRAARAAGSAGEEQAAGLEAAGLEAAGLEAAGLEVEAEAPGGAEEEVEEPGACSTGDVLGLPACVGERLLAAMDADGLRVLRAVSRSMYFDASRAMRTLVVTPDNLEVLLAMPLHSLCPHLHTLGQAAAAGAADTGTGFDLSMVEQFARDVLPHLHGVRVVDISESALHTHSSVWAALVAGAPHPGTHWLLKEPSAWARGAQGVLGSLTLFGKSAAAQPHGHRLASHLSALAGLPQLRRLELWSYEDISDVELAPLAACTRLEHLYVDSLFIKQAVGPVFPSLTSLTMARIKFILRPLTAIFPSLDRLRLGVLQSELNKKISSASLSCLAGCGPQLTRLCVCPVLWKGQWQVLPTLLGLTHLQLVHCRDLSHLREVLRV
ncbi:uncharacterized protein HaLaN_11366, partial [Haematococcus lacustris]